MAERLILVRHGEALGGAPGRLSGRTDRPLSEAGRRQARWVGETLASLIDRHDDLRVVSSPLRRARETAALALARAGHQPATLEQLSEVDVGDWEGLTFAEAAQRRPDETALWAAWDPAFTFPGGENLGAFLERVHDACDILASDEAGTVVAFTHGGVIRTAVCRLLGLESRHYLLFDVRPGCVATMRLFGDSGVLAGLRNPDELPGE